MVKEDIVNWKVPVPFAIADGANLYRMGTEASGITFTRGFSQIYSSEDGKKVSLGDVNGMFNSVLGASMFDQKGGWRTFSKDVSDAIGGYPEGAILYWYDEEEGKIRTVRSMKPDNTDDFVADPSLIDGVSWAFVDQVPISTLLVRMFAGKLGGSAFASTTVTWTAPFDCVIITKNGYMWTGSDGSSFLQVKNFPDEGFGTAGVISYIIPALLAQSAMYDYGDVESMAPNAPPISPPSGGGPLAPIVAYVARGGQVQVLSTGSTDSISFSYYPLTF